MLAVRVLYLQVPKSHVTVADDPQLQVCVVGVVRKTRVEMRWLLDHLCGVFAIYLTGAPAVCISSTTCQSCVINGSP